MTEYRSVFDGYKWFLQYKKTKRFLFFKWPAWRDVWKPYYDPIYGRSVDTTGVKCYVHSYTSSTFECFRSQWPDVNEYFKWAMEVQRKLVSDAEARRDKREKRKGETKYL